MDVRRVPTEEASTKPADDVSRVARDGERFVIERDGEPVAALANLDDLRRLEDAGMNSADGEDSAKAAYRRAMERAGLVVSWLTG